jgi:hypothetical protein
VILQVTGRNELASPLTPPAVRWTVEDHEAAGGARMPCQADAQTFDNTCYGAGQLAAGARCAGWLLFEVPEALEVPGSIVTARAYGVAPPESALWRLPPSDS